MSARRSKGLGCIGLGLRGWVPSEAGDHLDGSLSCAHSTTIVPIGGFLTPAVGRSPRCSLSWPATAMRPAQRRATPQNPANNIGNGTVSGPNGPIDRLPSSFRVTEPIDIDNFSQEVLVHLGTLGIGNASSVRFQVTREEQTQGGCSTRAARTPGRGPTPTPRRRGSDHPRRWCGGARGRWLWLRRSARRAGRARPLLGGATRAALSLAALASWGRGLETSGEP